MHSVSSTVNPVGDRPSAFSELASPLKFYTAAKPSGSIDELHASTHNHSIAADGVSKRALRFPNLKPNNFYI
jgi:hypothetical protein